MPNIFSKIVVPPNFYLSILIAIDKENQDAYIIKPSLHTNSIITGSSSHDGVEQAFFAIFDGHGKDGHSCAQYAKDYVSFLLVKKKNFSHSFFFFYFSE